MEPLRSDFQDLHDQYDKILDPIVGQDRQELLRLSQWVCFATRPLSLLELRYATAMDPNHPSKSIAEIEASPDFVCTDEDMQERILNLSHGLLEVISTSNCPGRMMASSGVMQPSLRPFVPNLVRPSHESVKEYLVNHGIRNLCNDRQHFNEASPCISVNVICDAHFYLARSCLMYLSTYEVMACDPERYYGTFDDDIPFFNEFPVAEYETKNWLTHVKGTEHGNTGMIEDIIAKSRSGRDPVFEHWATIFNRLAMRDPQCPCTGTTLLHEAARHGICSIVRAFLEFDTPALLNAHDNFKSSEWFQGGKGNTPLCLAAKAGQSNTVHLLAEDARLVVNLTNHDGQSPIALATERGHIDVVKVLLDHEKIELNAISSGSLNSSTGSSKIVRQFDREHGCTISFHAVLRGRTDVVQALIKSHRTNVNAGTLSNQTPLMAAAFYANFECAKLLLRAEAIDTNARDTAGWTALAYAAEVGCAEIVDLLITQGNVDINVKTNDGQTPLFLAVPRPRWIPYLPHGYMPDHPRTTRLLVENGGADVNQYADTPTLPIHACFARKRNRCYIGDATRSLQLASRGTSL